MADFPGFNMSGMIASFLFILLTMKQPDDFRVVGPAFPILARIGEDALLTCQLRPKRTAMNMEVRWYRSELDTPLMVYRDGAEVMETQMEEYRGRIERIEDSIAEGSVSLKIHNIQPSDDGQYWCRFQEEDHWGETSVLLQVAGLGSVPSIHVEGPGEEGVQLVCTAQGWFPEPQVYWEDMWGQRLVTVSEYHIPDEDGLFYVEDTLVVRNGSVDVVSCFLHNPVLSEGKEATIALPAPFQVSGPSQPILVRVGDDIELPCSLSPEADAQSMEVRWVRSHHHPAVHVHGDPAAGEQMAEYRGRTSLMSDAIHEERLALQIHGARASDDGWYRCLFRKDGVYHGASLEVKVIAVGSSPMITQEELKDGDTQLRCTSDGWFPEPHVQWRDAEGRMMSSFSEALHQGSHKLFHVETLLSVTNRSTVNVTCSVSNLPLGEEKTSTFSPWESRTTCLWKTLPVLGLLLALCVGLARMKNCPKATATLDPDTAHPEPTLSEGDKHIFHELPSSQTPHRDLPSCSQSPRRGSRQGHSTERWRSGMVLDRS